MWIKTGTEAVIKDVGDYFCDTCKKRIKKPSPGRSDHQRIKVNSDYKITLAVTGMGREQVYDFCGMECFKKFMSLETSKLHQESVKVTFPYEHMEEFKEMVTHSVTHKDDKDVGGNNNVWIKEKKDA